MEILVEDHLGTGSQIFTDPNGGLSLSQGINWFAPGSSPEFSIFDYRAEVGAYVTLMFGSLTSLSVSSQVPEPTSLVLVGTALCGVLLTRRRKRVSPGAGSCSVA